MNKEIFFIVGNVFAVNASNLVLLIYFCNMPEYSFIIPYRNRDVERVQRCIQSIMTQEYKNFEVIFVDYGSLSTLSHQVKNYLANFEFITYIYLLTEGWLWCKSHALNTGIELAKGKNIVVTDVDIIYAPNFLQVIQQHINHNNFCVYQCYYIPENFTKYSLLNFENTYSTWVKSDDTGTGLLAAPKEALVAIGGFDTFFKIWGFEDMDIFSRLQQYGLTFTYINTETVNSFHQWHLRNPMPYGWTTFMKEYWKNKKDYTEISPNIATTLNLAERPALQIYKHPTNEKTHHSFVFKPPFAQSCVDFMLVFNQLPSKKSIIIQQHFAPINTQTDSLVAQFFRLINQLFAYLNISYRITELKTFDTTLLSFEAVRDFIFFFLVSCESQIEDYYWQSDDLSFFELIIVKK
jgi:glycosyltransferase involved in cell wall biosynthesis